MKPVRSESFLAHLVYQPKSLMQSFFVSRASLASASLLAFVSSLALVSSVHTSPGHSFKHSNFIFGAHMHLCP